MKGELTVTLGQQLPTRPQELAGRRADPDGAESAREAQRVCGLQATRPAMGSAPRGGRGSRTGPGPRTLRAREIWGLRKVCQAETETKGWCRQLTFHDCTVWPAAVAWPLWASVSLS